jgi:2-polyprenyl-3-methyl-5-hydroxy-6-metoxy-1,4-benzoquinol methylase
MEVRPSLLNSAPGSAHNRVIALVGETKSVLELGCSSGYMSEAMRRHGCRIIGVEIDRQAAAEAATYCDRVIEGDLDELDLVREVSGQLFDVIVAADVLEHLRRPERVLASLSQLLTPHGYVVASIPNVAHGAVRLALLHGRFPYADKGLLDRTHLRFFTRDSMEELFDRSGFIVTSIERIQAPVGGTEIQFEHSLADGELMTSLQNDEEATTYQFVVVARPANGLPRDLTSRFSELLRHTEITRVRLREYEARAAGQAEEIARLREHARAVEETLVVLRGELDAHQRQADVLLAERVRLREALATRSSESDDLISRSDAERRVGEEERVWREAVTESIRCLHAAFTDRLEELISDLRIKGEREADRVVKLQEAEARIQAAAESEESLRRLLIEAHDELIQRDDHIIGLTHELGSHRLAAAELETLQAILAERDQGIAFLRGELKILEERLVTERGQWETQLAAAKEWAASESAAIAERDAIIERLQRRPGLLETLRRGIRRAAKLFG